MTQFLTTQDILTLLANHQAQLKKVGVRSLALFGSFAQGNHTSLSDVDLVVQFDTKSFDAYMDLKFFLEDLLGRHVDLVPTDSVKPQLRNSILENVVQSRDYSVYLEDVRDAIDRIRRAHTLPLLVEQGRYVQIHLARKTTSPPAS